MNRRAFTLIEVIIALSLFAVISVGVVAFVRDLRVQQRSLIRSTQQLEESSKLFDLLERGIATCIADAGFAGAGIQGTPASLRVLSREVGLHSAGRHSDLTAIEIRLDAGGKRIMGQLWTPGADMEPPREPIAESIEDLQFRFHDGTEWQTTFDSLARQGLPGAIEVAIWFEDDAPPPASTGLADSEGFGAPPAEASTVPRRQPDRLRIISVHDSGAGARP